MHARRCRLPPIRQAEASACAKHYRTNIWLCFTLGVDRGRIAPPIGFALTDPSMRLCRARLLPEGGRASLPRTSPSRCDVLPASPLQALEGRGCDRSNRAELRARHGLPDHMEPDERTPPIERARLFATTEELSLRSQSARLAAGIDVESLHSSPPPSPTRDGLAGLSDPTSVPQRPRAPLPPR